MIPTGSQDPYALRRQASGIVQILATKEWRIALPNLFNMSLSLYQTDNAEKIKADLLAFFTLRLKYVLGEYNIRYDIVDAVLGSTNHEITSLIERAKVLEKSCEARGI